MEYSVLVKRVVNLRFDGIRDESQRKAIEQTDRVPFHQFLNREMGVEAATNPDGSAITLRYIDDGEESNCYLVDEADDQEFSRSQWYGSDGTTPLEPGRVCGECLRPREGAIRRFLAGLRRGVLFREIS